MANTNTSVHHQAITIWMDYYQQQTGQKYVFLGAKDGTAMKGLLKKIVQKMTEKQIEPNDENLLNSLKGFLATIKDPWILDNLEIALVNSKFNSLYAKAIRNSPFTKGQQINEIVAQKYGADIKRAAG